MTNGFSLIKGHRPVVVFEVKTGGEQGMSIHAAPYRGLRSAIRHRIPKLGRADWVRIEVELDVVSPAEIGYLTFVFSPKEREIGLRNLRIASRDSAAGAEPAQ